MKPGDLYKPTRRGTSDGESTVAQVMKTWNKRDIDPDCPLSVAIIPMVQFVVWSDGQKGGTFNFQRQSFHRQYTRVEVAQ